MAPLLTVGLLLGAVIVNLLVPLAFPSSYSDGTLGEDARALFVLMLPGWGAAMLSAPALGAVQAGPNPWRYALHSAAGLIFALVSGLVLIPRFGVSGAALTTTFTALAMALTALFLRPEPRSTCWSAWFVGLLSMAAVPAAWMASPPLAVGVTGALLLPAVWVALRGSSRPAPS